MYLNHFIIFLGSFLFVFFLMPPFIKLLQKIHIGQFVREEGPKEHLSKIGTPTMGGLLFILAVLVIYGIFVILYGGSLHDYLPLYALLAYSCIGFLDDYRKTILQSPYGLKAREDITLQIALSLPLMVWIYYYGIFSVPIFFGFFLKYFSFLLL